MKIINAFLILNKKNGVIKKPKILKAYETDIGWFKIIKRKDEIYLEKTTPEEIMLLSSELRAIMLLSSGKKLFK